MGTAIRPGGSIITGRRSRPVEVKQAGAHERERLSLAVVLFFILASTAISVYDLALLVKLLL